MSVHNNIRDTNIYEFGDIVKSLRNQYNKTSVCGGCI